MMRVKINDTVKVISGKDKDKKGTVIDILLDKNKVKVKDIAIKTIHKKARRQGQESAIKKEEGYINLSNVMPVCRSCSKPCRIKIKFLSDGKKARVCGQCEEIM